VLAQGISRENLHKEHVFMGYIIILTLSKEFITNSITLTFE